MKNSGRLIVICGFTLLIASLVFAHRADDWTQFDHQTFHVVGIHADNSLLVETTKNKLETVALHGIVPVEPARAWLTWHAANHDVTLMLESPQTRNSDGNLEAFVFLGTENLNVELVKEGFAYADRRGKTVMDGLIDPAEAEARKKKRGIWYGMTDDQQPAWRKAWLRSLPSKAR